MTLHEANQAFKNEFSRLDPEGRFHVADCLRDATHDTVTFGVHPLHRTPLNESYTVTIGLSAFRKDLPDNEENLIAIARKLYAGVA